MGDDQPGRVVEGVHGGGEEHLVFNFPFAGGSVDGAEDEGEIADGDVGGGQGWDVGLLVDEGEDGERGVSGGEEDEKQQAHLESFSPWVHLT